MKIDEKQYFYTVISALKIASNKIADLVRFYKETLHHLYDHGELQAIIELVFYHYLRIPKTDLLTRQNDHLNQSDVLKIYDCCKALATGRPVQYVLGEAEFYGLVFRVDPSVLIPRPETEELVDLLIKDRQVAGGTWSLLDIGTGSGCIPVTVKKWFPQAAVYAMDISADALRTASENATLNKTEVLFFRADILTDHNFAEGRVFDVIISNPPYIRADEAREMANQVKQYEPHQALFVEHDDAIVFYKKIIDMCRNRLAAGGVLYTELNPLTADHVKAYARASSIFSDVSLLKDLSGKIRFLKALV